MNRLSHPPLGRDPLLVGAALVLTLLLSISVVVQYLLATYGFVGDRWLAAVWLYDGFVGTIILVTGVSWIVAILYGWANGGPLLTAALALVPTALATAIRFELIVTADMIMAAAVATMAIWLAAWTSYPPYEKASGREWIVLLGGAITAFATVVAWRETIADGPQLVALGLIVIGSFTGLVWLIATVRT